MTSAPAAIPAVDALSPWLPHSSQDPPVSSCTDHSPHNSGRLNIPSTEMPHHPIPHRRETQ